MPKRKLNEPDPAPAAPGLLTVEGLAPDHENRRRHTPRNIEMISASLREVGAARSIVIDEDDNVLAGNGVLQAARSAGITRVQVVEVDGETLVAVRRRGLTDEKKRALAIFDNRAAELAEWNEEQLEVDAEAGLDMRSFWTAEEEAGFRSSAVAESIEEMATETDPHAERAEPARDEGYQTFSCPLTLAQERIVRAALRAARAEYRVTTTGEALTAALEAWGRFVETPIALTVDDEVEP